MSQDSVHIDQAATHNRRHHYAGSSPNTSSMQAGMTPSARDAVRTP